MNFITLFAAMIHTKPVTMAETPNQSVKRVVPSTIVLTARGAISRHAAWFMPFLNTTYGHWEATGKA